MSYRCKSVQWAVEEVPVFGDLEQLASLAHEVDEETGIPTRDRILRSGVLYWQLFGGQTLLPLGPLCFGSAIVGLTTSSQDPWSILLRFGPEAPKMRRSYRVRVVVFGSYIS